MPSRAEQWVPKAAVAAVVVAALTATFMVKRAERDPEVAMRRATPPASQPSVQAHAPDKPLEEPPPVVTAPPLKSPPKLVAQPTPAPAPSTRALGAPAACPSCGVVETVVAIKASDEGEPSGYQMHIRMDDGSVKTVEQRGALPAGSRVRIEAGKLRALQP